MDDCKRCSRCGEVLPHSDYYRRKDGTPFQPCKRCACAKVKDYRRANPEAVRQSKLKEGRKNAARYRERARKWYADNVERALENKRLYRLANRERLNEYQREYARQNPEKSRAAVRNAHAKRPDYYLLLTRKPAVRQNVYVVPFSQEALAAKVRYWGDRCWVCRGEHQAIDHVKPIAKGGPHVLANLRPICKRCNSRKGNQWPYVVGAKDDHTKDEARAPG